MFPMPGGQPRMPMQLYHKEYHILLSQDSEFILLHSLLDKTSKTETKYCFQLQH